MYKYCISVHPGNTIVLHILFDIYYTFEKSPAVISSVPKPRELPSCALPTQTAAFYAQWKQSRWSTDSE